MKKKEQKVQGSRIRFNGLFRKIFLTAILCMLIPMIITVITTLLGVYSNSSETQQNNMSQLALEKMNEVDFILDNQDALTKSVARSPYIMEVVAKQQQAGKLDAAENEKLGDFLADIFENGNGIYENYFITCETEGIADGLGGATLHDVTGEVWYDNCMANGTHRGNDISPVSGNPVYNLCYAINDPDTGKPVGAVNTALDLGAMTGKITGSIEDEDTQVLIVDTEGYVIASHNTEQILQLNFNEESESTKQAMEVMAGGDSGILEFHLNDTDNIGAFYKSGTMYMLVFVPKTVYMAAVTTLISRIVIVALICLIGAGVIITAICRNIIRPLNRMVGIVEKNGDADFTETVPQNLLRRRDEIGVLAKSMDKMEHFIREIFEQIMEQSSAVDVNVVQTSANMDSLTQMITNVSELTTTRAAEMEETAASTDIMATNASYVKDSVAEINQDTKKGKEMTFDIRQRAQDLKENAVKSQSNAVDLTEEISNNLSKAIEQSKAVNQINELSEGILEIASQTNLLALNASIEAARAGEQGKGFAVVAEEIRKLAENSQSSVEAIQKVTRQVIVAVSNLSENAERVIEFLSQSVIKEYQSMVDIGEQYYNDAQNMEQIVDAINYASEELRSAIDTMILSIEEIATANNAGAAGITEIAQNTADISANADNVTAIMEEVKDNTLKLKGSMERFTL